MNSFVCSGRLTKKPELKSYTQSNGTENKFSQFSIAISRTYKNKEGKYDADFFDGIVYGKMAENICYYCDKGSKISLVGAMENNNYQQDGKTIYRNVIRVKELEIDFSTVDKDKFKNKSSNNQQNQTSNNSYNDITEDDLPF